MKIRAFYGMCLIVALFSSMAFADESNGDQQFEGFTLQGFTDEGDKSWDVKGETADINGTEVKLSNVDANSYGEEQVNVTANNGTLDQASGNMLLENDVVITSERGTQLMTDSLEWDKEGDMVSTDDDVFITDDQLLVTGTGMTAQPGLKNARIKEDVMVRVSAENEQAGEEAHKVTVTSDGPVIIDQVLSKARFEDNVVALHLDQRLTADVMEVLFNEDMNDIEELVCLGNVEITQGENIVTAEKAVYDAKAQKVKLFGRPKLQFVSEGDNAFKTFGN